MSEWFGDILCWLSTLLIFPQVIIATDIAETSITIDDVIYVVDVGKHKEMRYNAQKVWCFLFFQNMKKLYQGCEWLSLFCL